MASAEFVACRRQFAIQEQCHGALRRALLAQDEGSNPFATQSFRSSPSHAIAEDGIAVAERFHNGDVAVRAMIVSLLAAALASAVSGEGVASHFLADDLAVHNVENQEARAAAEMRRYIRTIR